MGDDQGSLLSKYRGLHVAEEYCLLCGKIVSGVGPGVIKIEKLDGSPARSIGPFCEDVVHPEICPYWFAYNATKRSINVNIESRDGQGLFKRLTKTADLVIESFHPGHMDSLGSDYPVLSKRSFFDCYRS